jgi:hypothetical protein
MEERAFAARIGVGGLLIIGGLMLGLLAPTSAMAIGYQASADTYATSENPSSTHGDEDKLKAGYADTGKRQRAYMKFPLPNGGPACQVESPAVLNLSYITPPPWGEDFRIGVPDAAWSEATLNWNNKPDPASGSEITPAWNFPGVAIADVTPVIQYLYDHGIPSRGLVMRSTSTDTFDAVKFWSSDYAFANGFPYVNVQLDCS